MIVSASSDKAHTADGAFPIVVLISGSGSNLQAIIDASKSSIPGLEICLVISNKPDAYGLERASRAGIATQVIDHRNYHDRASFEQALMAEIDSHSPRLVVLAGFMRILEANFVRHYEGRLINIHPSLLPRYPGLNTHRRAIENGDDEAGASVHFVSAEVDSGPTIIQAHVPIHANDTPDGLAARVLQQEHVIFPRAIRWIAEGRLTIQHGEVLLDGHKSPEQQLYNDEF